MDVRVLVTYASKYGATTEIAERIGQVISESGLSTDVLSVEKVNNLAHYKVVVLGSAVYMGRWRREAARFLKTNEKVLGEQMVWLFSSGPMDKGDPLELVEGLYLPKGLQPVAERIGPKDIVVFHGVAVLEKMNFFDRWIMKKVKAPAGDFRDWESIVSWAKGIAYEVKETTFH